MKKVFLIIFFLFLVSSVHAQNPEWRVYKSIRNYSDMISRNNYLWALRSSPIEIVKIDKTTGEDESVDLSNGGRNFLIKNWHDFDIDSTGNLWFVGSQNIVCWNPDDDEHENYYY